jgi:hypothetical protein
MRLPRTLAAITALALLTACSSATNGKGTTSKQTPTGSGSADFPSSSNTGTTPNPTDTSVLTPSGSGTATDTGSPRPTKPLRTATVTAPDGTSFLVSIWADRTDPTCTDHAHGRPVIAYLTAHPCAGLRRLLATTTVAGHAVGMAISDLGFKGVDPQVYTIAGRFVTLVKKDGTGNIDDLLRSGYQLPAGPSAIPSPDATSAVGQDAGVEIVDAWYLDGPTASNDPKLVAMAKALFLQLG